MTDDSSLRDATIDGPADDASGFVPDESLYHHVDRAVRKGTPVSIEHRELGSLRLWPHQGVYECGASSLAQFCADRAESYRVHSLGHRSAAPDNAGRVEDLLWTIGFAASSGRLVDSLFGTEVIQLSQWPNLARVPTGHSGLRLSALFCRYPTSITVAARLAGAERAEVYQFLSAAWCAGLVRVVNRPSEAQDQANGAGNGGSLVRALLRRLWG